MGRWSARLTPEACPLGIQPVICGSHINAFGIVRSLAPSGWRPLLLDHERRLATASRFTRFLPCPDPDEDEAAFVAACRRTAEAVQARGATALFFPTNDEWLRPLAQHHEALSEVAMLPFPRWDRIRTMLDKGAFAERIADADVPAPATAVVRGAQLAGTPPEGFTLPVIVKPADWTPKFLDVFHEKAVVARTSRSWQRLVRRLARSFADTALVVQEYIPGGADTLWTVTSYSDASGAVRGLSMGHKVLQKPPEAGTIVSGATRYVEELEDHIRRLSRAFGMYGIANTEFKYDPRDGRFKVLEINMRTGMWHYSAAASGVNLPLMCLQDAAGVLPEEPETVRGEREVYWTVALEELLWRLRYRKHRVRDEDRLRRLPRVYAVWTPDDPGPFWFMVREYATAMFRRRRVWI